MNNQTTKHGFSLVEVMILFTVLAVAMAAALPVITKKSKAVPQNVSHGVYRCIALSNGKFREEKYNTSKLLSNPETAETTSCSFKVPKATVYKIDIYSAGAGGTKYAAYYPEQDDNRDKTFGMSDAENYALKNETNFNSDMPHDLTDEEIRNAFYDIGVIRTGFTGNGGKGGDARYSYFSPKKAKCNATNDPLLPSVYNTDDTLNKQINKSVRDQFEDFCLENHSNKNAFFESSDANPERLGEGGDGGQGAYIALSYAPTYGTYERTWYEREGEQFPYVRYIGELYGNIGNRGYEIDICTSLSPISNCQKTVDGKINNAEDGETIDNTVENFNKTIVCNGDECSYTGGDGSDIGDKYIAFHIPSFNDLNQAGSYTTIQTTSATGGKGSSAGYTKSNKSYTAGSKDFLTDYAWLTFAKEKGANGNNAETSGSITEERYKIERVNSFSAQEPLIKMDAKLWSKKYSIGKPGTPGKHVHIQTSTMGNRCEFTIPHAGPTFDYLALVQKANAEGIVPSTFLSKTRDDYEKKLGAKITCYDKDDMKVVDQTLEGGKYDIEPTAWTQTFQWNKAFDTTDNPHVVKLSEEGLDPGFDGITSRYAKIFKKMTSLKEYRTSVAGTGTVINDYCVVPKGEYNFQTYLLQSSNGSEWIENALNGLNQKLSLEYDGTIGGSFDCYRTNGGKEYREFDIDNLSNVEKQYYKIDPPTEAGGGAIIIVF